MDNMKYYNDSLAYDFDMFMPKTTVRQEEDNIIKLHKNEKKSKAQRKTAVKRATVPAFVILFAVIIIAALCGNIFLRIRINEVNSEINSIKTEINAVDSEITGLQMEMEKRISYSNIEIEATEMGMQKKDKTQVKYIRVNDTDTVVNEKGETVSTE